MCFCDSTTEALACIYLKHVKRWHSVMNEVGLELWPCQHPLQLNQRQNQMESVLQTKTNDCFRDVIRTNFSHQLKENEHPFRRGSPPIIFFVLPISWRTEMCRNIWSNRCIRVSSWISRVPEIWIRLRILLVNLCALWFFVGCSLASTQKGTSLWTTSFFHYEFICLAFASIN